MNISDQRLEEIGTSLLGNSKQEPAVTQQEIVSMANELRQLRLRIYAKSCSSLPPAAGSTTEKAKILGQR